MGRFKIACVIVTMACAAACAETGSPAAPSALTPTAGGNPGSSSGGTITGTVQSGASALALTAGTTAGGLTVQIVGTNLTATTGSLGQFTLNGVPTGNVELRFSGPGIDAKITIMQVENGETITIVVSVRGTSAVVKTEERRGHGNGETRVNGVVEGLSGTASGFWFSIGTRQIHGNSQTEFFGEGPSAHGFANLRNGRRVEVKGMPGIAFIIANRIHINGEDREDEEDDDADEVEDREAHEVEFTGRILAINVPNLTVGSRTVHTTGATVIRRRGNIVGFDALRMQQEVEVKGTLQPDGGVNAQKITIEDDNLPEAQVRGPISGLRSTPSCPSITFSVAVAGSPIVTIVTNSATEFDDVRCNQLQDGNRVRVDGVREPNGNIRAKRVKRDN